MNSEKQIIINPKLEEKVKNPKRVAQGKRLAEISKAARERKRAEQQNEDERESDFLQLPNLTTSISLIGVATGVIGTYIAWKNFKQEEVNAATPLSPSKPKPEPLPKPTPNPTEVKYNNLDDDDI